MADNQTDTGVPQGTEQMQQGQTSTTSELEQARAALEEQKRLNEAQRNQYNHFRQQYEEELRRIRQRSQDYDQQPYEEQQQQQSTQGQHPEMLRRRQEQEELDRQEMGLIKYKVNNPDWQSTWDDVYSIMNDPQRAQEVASWDAFGRPDYEKSFRNAKRLVEFERLKKAQEQTEQHKQKAAQEQERQKAQATVSGVPASAGEEQIDVTNMTSDEMLEKGLVDFDPSDAPQPLFPKRQK